MGNVFGVMKPHASTRAISFRRKRRDSGFTLVEILLVLMVVAILAALILPVLSAGRERGRNAQCNLHLSALAIALDAYRQENGHYPAALAELTSDNYIHNSDILHCPSDPNPSGSYGDYYIVRGPHDSGDLPVLVCPFHEGQGNEGNQAFLGRYTSQFITAPASLSGVNAAQVQHPGGTLVTAYSGMQLHGGDCVITSSSGGATIQFADGSNAILAGGSNVSVLQSFLDGTTRAPLYTLLHQALGDVKYSVNHGSKFDVSTPAATAGALGTSFEIVLNSSGSGSIECTSGTVRLASIYRTNALTNNVWTPLPATASASPTSTPTPTPAPTATATPVSTATPVATATPTVAPTPTVTPTPHSGDDNGGGGGGDGHGDH